MPRSIFRSMRSDPGSIGSMAMRAPSAGSRKRLRLTNRVPPSRGSNTNVQTQFPSSERHASTPLGLHSIHSHSVGAQAERVTDLRVLELRKDAGRAAHVEPSRFSIQSYV